MVSLAEVAKYSQMLVAETLLFCIRLSMHKHRLAAFCFHYKISFSYSSLGQSINFHSLTVEPIPSISLSQFSDVITFQASQKLEGNFSVLSFLLNTYR